MKHLLIISFLSVLALAGTYEENKKYCDELDSLHKEAMMDRNETAMSDTYKLITENCK